MAKLTIIKSRISVYEFIDQIEALNTGKYKKNFVFFEPVTIYNKQSANRIELIHSSSFNWLAHESYNNTSAQIYIYSFIFNHRKFINKAIKALNNE